MFELTVLQLIVGGIVSVMAGGVGVALVNYWLGRRSLKAKAIITEGEGYEQLLSKIKALVKEQVDNVSLIKDYQTEVQTLKTLRVVDEKESNRQKGMMKEILIEQGRAEEREKNCQRELSHIKERLSEYDDLALVNKRLVQDNLRMQGTIDEFQRDEET